MPTDLASKTSKVFLELTYGDPKQAFRRVNVSVDQQTPFGQFFADTSMEFSIPNATGTLQSSSALVSISIESDFAKRISDGKAHAEVEALVMELEEGADPLTGEKQSVLRYLFAGIVTTARRNPKQKEGIVQLGILSHKSELDYALGLQANENCGWTLGDPHTCRASTFAFEEKGVISSINGLVIQVSGISEPREGMWSSGYIRREGLSALIRYRDQASTTFHLGKLVPDDWLGKEVTFIPGCDKTVNSCIFWQNLPRWSGLGLNIPTRHPVFENGS